MYDYTILLSPARLLFTLAVVCSSVFQSFSILIASHACDGHRATFFAFY